MRVADLKSWLLESSSPDDVQYSEGLWADFGASAKPRLTLFGAYDTGKSSILRRLLVDAGLPIPDWLTVSARHETAISNVVDLGPCFVRDTPGLSPGGEDARSVRNSTAARAALGLTDGLLVTTGPQLPTGERAELIEILSLQWSPGTVWFLISRADAGTVDPMIDQDGYRSWARQKVDELRESLRLSQDVPVHVIAADYGELGSFDPAPTRDTWELSRSWDGMHGLSKALADLPRDGLSEFRSAAETRFWTIASEQRLFDLRLERDRLRSAHDVAALSARSASTFLRTLDAMEQSAQVSLEGSVEEAVRRVLLSPVVDAASLRESVAPVLDEWWNGQLAGLARIRQDAMESLETDVYGRGWARFEALYLTYTEPEPESTEPGTSFTPHLESLGDKLAQALGSVDRIRRAHQAARNPSRAAEILDTGMSLGRVAELVTAVLPVITELSEMLENKVQSDAERRHERARRERIEADVTRIVRHAADQAMSDFRPNIVSLRSEVLAQSVGPDAVTELKGALDSITELVGRGESIVLGAVRPT